MRKFIRIILGAAAAIALLAAGFYALSAYTEVLPSFLRQPAPAPAPATERVAGWRQDLAYFSRQLTHLHPGPYTYISKEEWAAAVAALDADIPNLTDQEIVAGFMRLAARLEDGHTRVSPPDSVTFHFYPLLIYLFEDGAGIINAAPEYQDLIGWRIAAINGVSTEEAIHALGQYVPHDNPSDLKLLVHSLLVCPEFLQMAGVAPEGGEIIYTLEKAGEAARELTFQPVTDEAYNQLLQNYNADAAIVYQGERGQEPYWFEFQPDTGLLYIQYNQCAEAPNLPMKDFAAQVRQAIADNPTKRLAIDLRLNGGGNSTVIEPLFQVIRESALNQEGQLFVLIGRQTFSSAMLNTVDFASQTQATFLGETPGGSPSHFGEVKSLRLPYSQTRLRYSTKHFVDAQYPGREFPPDVTIAATTADFLARRDPLMDYLRTH